MSVDGDSDLSTPLLLMAMPQVARSVLPSQRGAAPPSRGRGEPRLHRQPADGRSRSARSCRGWRSTGGGRSEPVAYFGGPVQPQLGHRALRPRRCRRRATSDDRRPRSVPGVALTQHVGDLSRLAEDAARRASGSCSATPAGARGSSCEEILRNDWLTAPVQQRPDLRRRPRPGLGGRPALGGRSIPAALPSWIRGATPARSPPTDRHAARRLTARPEPDRMQTEHHRSAGGLVVRGATHPAHLDPVRPALAAPQGAHRGGGDARAGGPARGARRDRGHRPGGRRAAGGRVLVRREGRGRRIHKRVDYFLLAYVSGDAADFDARGGLRRRLVLAGTRASPSSASTTSAGWSRRRACSTPIRRSPTPRAPPAPPPQKRPGRRKIAPRSGTSVPDPRFRSRRPP